MITHLHSACPRSGAVELYQCADGRECVSCGWQQLTPLPAGRVSGG